MKKRLILPLFAIALLSCNLNSEFEAEIKTSILDKYKGIDVEYDVISTNVIETLKAGEQSQSLHKFCDSMTMVLTDLFSDVNKEKLIEYRAQELKFKGRDDYYDFLFSTDCDSPFCEELRNVITTTDDLIAHYPDVEKLTLYKNVCWYRGRYARYYDLKKEYNLYENMASTIDLIQRNEVIADSLSKLDPAKIIKYTVRHTFAIRIGEKSQTTCNDYSFDPDNMSIIDVKPVVL
ncbi:MAG: hypothetical protein JXR39_11385 [Marinilabiliaceae bacterium]|nr:hypothetical protein [Marinilabiliaceae bacterium]